MRVLPLLIVALFISACTRTSSSGPVRPQPTIDAKKVEENRKKRSQFRFGIDGTNGYDFNLEGPEEDVLVIIHPTWTLDKAKKYFNDTSPDGNGKGVAYHDLGFKELRFQTDQDRSKGKWWSLDLTDGKWSSSEKE